MKTASIRSVIQYIIFLGLGLFLIWYSVHNLTPLEKQKLYQSFSEVEYIYIIPVIVLLMLSHVSRAMRWKLLMQPLGYQPRFANTFIAVLLGYLFNLLVPRLGEVMKCTILARYEKIAPDKLIGTIVAERAFDVVSLLIVVVIMLLTQWNVVGNVFMSDLQQASKTASPGTILLRVLIVATSFALVIIAIRFTFRKFKRNLFVLRVRKVLRNIWRGLLTIRSLRHPVQFLLHTVFIWLCYLAGIWAGFFAYYAVENIGMGAALSVLVFGSFGMILTQGGIGAYQIAVQRTLALYGIPLVAGLSFGWIMWGAQTAIVIVFGAIAFALLPFINRKTVSGA